MVRPTQQEMCGKAHWVATYLKIPAAGTGSRRAPLHAFWGCMYPTAVGKEVVALMDFCTLSPAGAVPFLCQQPPLFWALLNVAAVFEVTSYFSKMFAFHIEIMHVIPFVSKTACSVDCEKKRKICVSPCPVFHNGSWR